MKKVIVFLSLIVMSNFVMFSQVNKLHDFESETGRDPYDGLITDGTYLYGLAQYGGTNSGGVAYKIKTDGTDYQVLHHFTNEEGTRPDGTLVLVDGYLYGSTYENGLNTDGCIFKIKTDGTEFEILLNLDDMYVPHMITDGTNLLWMVYMDLDPGVDGLKLCKLPMQGGALEMIHVSDEFFLHIGIPVVIENTMYVVNRNGGNFGSGYLFKLNMDGTGFEIIYHFNVVFNTVNYDGEYFYGTSTYGGTNSSGVLFKIKPDGTEYSVLKEFDYDSGSEPEYGLTFTDDLIYGLCQSGTSDGDGGIFSINKDGSNYQILYACDLFNSKGINPRGYLLPVGNKFYGVFQLGGANYVGTIFSFNFVSNVSLVNALGKVNIYPNPTQDFIQIENLTDCKSIEIFNIAGQLVISQTITSESNLKIDISQLNSGNYFVKLVDSNNNIFSSDFVKN